MSGRRRHLLVDTEGLVLKVEVSSAKVPDQDGLKLPMDSARTAAWRLKHLWLDAGYEGRGKRWAEEVLGLSVEIVRHSQKPVLEEVARNWPNRVGQGGQEGRLAEDDAAARLRGIADALGRGAHLLVALSEQADEQGLREALRNR